MKKFIILALSILLLGNTGIMADSSTDLYFIYIAHDRTSSVKSLTSTLLDIYNSCVKYGYAGVFYLSNGDEPIIVNVNFAKDNREDFNALIGELQDKTSHDVSPGTDVKRIVEIFNNDDFIDEKGNLRYTSVTWNYYVSELFWKMGYNESVIARLNWIMNFTFMKDEDIYVNVFHPSNDQLELTELPFGEKNIGNINEEFLLLEY